MNDERPPERVGVLLKGGWSLIRSFGGVLFLTGKLSMFDGVV